MLGFSPSPAPDTGPLVCLRGVSKSYPGVQALRDVNLDLHAGEIVAICGANGAGKSTLARLLSGQEPATAGEIRVAGRTHPIGSQRDAFESGILMMHQEPLIVDDFTVGENVWLYALRGGGTNPWRARPKTNDNVTRAALTKVGLRGISTTRLAASLAPGQRQMLALTRAVVNPHRVLILDETTASTTESYFELVKAMVAREKAAGTLVIFVSHRMQEVLGIADRIVVLRNGALVTTLDARATNAHEITLLMIGDALRVVHRPPSVPASAAGPKLKVSGLCAGSARDVSFTVEPGEIVGFYGLVGSGRSSVARSITGQMRARSGSIVAHGRKPDLGNPRTALAAGIAYVSEDRRREGFVPDFTNGYNLTLNTLARHSRRGIVNLRGERAAADRLVEQYGVKGASSTMTTTLSGGNQQKVCIAKWIAADPEIIVFDEPTKGIDVGARTTIYEIDYEMASRGKAIVVVSSEAEEILLLSHRVLVMRDGRLVAELDSASSSTEDLARPALGADAS